MPKVSSFHATWPFVVWKRNGGVALVAVGEPAQRCSRVRGPGKAFEGHREVVVEFDHDGRHKRTYKMLNLTPLQKERHTRCFAG